MHNGQAVAAKAVRVYLTSDSDRIRKVGCFILLVFSKLTASDTRDSARR